jgi:hypothetical protein
VDRELLPLEINDERSFRCHSFSTGNKVKSSSSIQLNSPLTSPSNQSTSSINSINPKTQSPTLKLHVLHLPPLPHLHNRRIQTSQHFVWSLALPPYTWSGPCRCRALNTMPNTTPSNPASATTSPKSIVCMEYGPFRVWAWRDQRRCESVRTRLELLHVCKGWSRLDAVFLGLGICLCLFGEEYGVIG